MAKRSTVNFVLDLVSFLNLLGLIFTGIILRYILPPGSGGHGRGFRGGRGEAEAIVREIWSLSRHEWGSVHFWMAAVFVVLMILHIVLHWEWIKCYVKAIVRK